MTTTRRSTRRQADPVADPFSSDPDDDLFDDDDIDDSDIVVGEFVTKRTPFWKCLISVQDVSTHGLPPIPASAYVVAVAVLIVSSASLSGLVNYFS